METILKDPQWRPVRVGIAFSILLAAAGYCHATGGNVQGTRTGQSDTGTPNSIPKYKSNGQIGNSSITDNGTTVATSEGMNDGANGTTVLSGGASNTAATASVQKGLFSFSLVNIGTGSTTVAVTYGTTIPVISSYLSLLSTGGPVTLINTPSISTIDYTGAAIPDGTWLILTSTSTSNPVILQSSGTLASSGLKLGGANGKRTLQAGSVLMLIWDASLRVWKEAFYLQ